MHEALLKADLELFLQINRGWTNPVFDFLMPWMRESAIWIPLYVIILYLLYKRTGWKNTMIILAMAGLMIFIGDTVITEWAKYHFKRLRPCHEPMLVSLMRLRLDSCGGQYGFFSAHAENHFALATLFSFTIPQIKRMYIILLFIWAFVIGYAQIYVGKHYPLDIIFGAIVGICVGAAFCLAYKMLVKKFASNILT